MMMIMITDITIKLMETGSVISSPFLTLMADSQLGDGDGLTCKNRVCWHD